MWVFVGFWNSLETMNPPSEIVFRATIRNREEPNGLHEFQIFQNNLMDGFAKIIFRMISAPLGALIFADGDP
jgi:hypothetical protein